MGELVEAQKQVEQQIKELVAAQKRSEHRLDQMDGRLGNMRGRELELKYRDKVSAYFGRWLRRARVADMSALREDLEQRLTQDQVEEIMLLDLIVQGAARQIADQPETWLALEISAVIDREDVLRAHRRAGLLRQAGYRAVPVVAGDALTLGAEKELDFAPIIVLRDGQSQGWDAALASA